MNVRFANEKDIPQMLDLLWQVELVHHEARPDLFRNGGVKYDEAALKVLLQDKNRPILAAAGADGKMVGYAFCILKETKNDPVLLDRKELYIDDLCVDASVRGKGVAQLLWQKAVSYAKDLGCDAVTLNVWEGNDRARHFYDNCGLKPRNTHLEFSL